jgi:hypothetical protein
MSSEAEIRFAYPAAGAAASAGRYVADLLALLGERDPLDVLAATAGELERAVSGLDDAVARRPEAPGKWSVVHVLQHLADSELVWAYRLRRVIAEERPPLRGYDQDAWAERLGYAAVRVDEALELFRVVRASNLRLVRALGPGELARVGVHAERGEETVAQLVKLYAAHDLVHLRQIARIRAAAAP